MQSERFHGDCGRETISVERGEDGGSHAAGNHALVKAPHGRTRFLAESFPLAKSDKSEAVAGCRRNF